MSTGSQLRLSEGARHETGLLSKVDEEAGYTPNHGLTWQAMLAAQTGPSPIEDAMQKLLVHTSLITLLAGCSAFPSQVQNPTAADKQNPSVFLAKSSSGPSVPTTKSGPEAAKQAEVFARTWRSANQELLLERDLVNNAQFGLLVAGVYNTVRNSMPAGKWALAGAGGVGLLLDRYQTEAQALAYRQGADAMECVRTSVELVPSSLWAQYDADGLLAIQTTQLEGAGIEKAQEAIDSLSTLLLTIHATLSNVVNKVYENVSSKAVRVPKADDIVKAVEAQKLSAPDSDKKALALSLASKTGANSESAVEELRQLQADLDLVTNDEIKTNQRIADLRQANPALMSDSPAAVAGGKKPRNTAQTSPGAAVVARLTEQALLAQDERKKITQKIASIKGRAALVASKSGPFPAKPAIEMALQLPSSLRACEAKLP